jgi:phosphoenolpyruvate-protein kinase (PTS system EI component)
MNIMTKKITINLMVGIMQVGFGAAAVIEASPLHIDGLHQILLLDDRQHQREQWQHQETERHRLEMQQRPNESEQEWHNRQDVENRRHENTMREVEAG